MLTAFPAAFDVSAKINQFGAYAGLAAIVGLGILSLLYFSQAREVKRLRDWAGRAPERAAELEAAAQQRAASASAAQPVAAAQQPRLAPHPQASGNVSPAAPLSAAGAAGAAVGASGAPKPAGAAPGPVQPVAPVGAAQDTVISRPGGAPATPAAAPPAAGTPATPPVVTPATPAPDPVVPAPAATPAAATPTPAARPAPAAPLRNAPPVSYQPQSARTRGEAQRELGVEERSPLRTTLFVVGGVIAVAVIVFVLVTQVFGGSSDSSSTPNVVGTATTVATTAKKTKTKTTKTTAAPTVVRSATNVVVLNGTQTPGLAATQATKLQSAGFKSPVGTGTNVANQALTASTVYFAEGKRGAGDAVAQVLGLPQTSVRALDAATKTVAASQASDSNPDVVVVAGSDLAGA